MPRAFFGDSSLPLPLLGFRLAAHCREGIRVGTEQAGAVGEGAVDVQLRDLKLGHCGIELAQVRTGTGGDDRQLHLAGCVEVLGFLGADNVQGPVRASQSSFAVSHDGQVHVGAADPAVGPELPQGFAVVPGGVGGQAHGFADSRQPAAAPAGRQSVLEGELGLFVDEAAGHDEVAGDPFGALWLPGS